MSSKSVSEYLEYLNLLKCLSLHPIEDNDRHLPTLGNFFYSDSTLAFGKQT